LEQIPQQYMMRDDVVGEGLVVCAEEEVMGLSYS